MMIWIILAVAVMAFGIWMCVKPYFPTALAAYAGLWILKASGAIDASASLMTAWGIAVIILLLIDYMQPPAISKATNGTMFFTIGAMAGTAVGLNFMSQAGIVICVAAGVVFGGLAYSRSVSGRALRFPSVRFFQYLCAKGFPIAVTFSIIGVAVLLWVIRHYPAFALEKM